MPIEKIIVLEDDAIVRKTSKNQLRQRRYDVAATGTIADAQEYLRQGQLRFASSWMSACRMARAPSCFANSSPAPKTAGRDGHRVRLR